MQTYRNPDDVQAARVLAALLAFVLGIGIATTLVPTAQTLILACAAVLLGLYLAGRVVAWRVRDRRLDRAAYLAGHDPARTDRGAA